MEIISNATGIQITLSEPEAQFLNDIFLDVVEKYRQPPSDMAEKSAEVFYSSFGTDHLRMSDEERELWNEQLHDLRTEECTRIDKWIKALSSQVWPYHWIIPYADVDTFLILLNDRRLWCAAENGLDEDELEHDFQSIKDPSQRAALFEIHFLAAIIEKVIQEISGDEEDESGGDSDVFGGDEYEV